MRRYTSLAAILFCSALGALPLLAQAQSYRCTGTDGKRYYGQTARSSSSSIRKAW